MYMYIYMYMYRYIIYCIIGRWSSRLSRNHLAEIPVPGGRFFDLGVAFY